MSFLSPEQLIYQVGGQDDIKLAETDACPLHTLPLKQSGLNKLYIRESDEYGPPSLVVWLSPLLFANFADAACPGRPATQPHPWLQHYRCQVGRPRCHQKFVFVFLFFLY